MWYNFLACITICPAKKGIIMNKQRILAIIGLVLIIVSVLCVICVGFLPQAKELLMNISTVTFLAAATILGLLVYRRKAEEEAGQPEDDANEDAQDE